MRIEDLDGPRIKPNAAAAALETIRWLGMDWDGEVLRQSSDLAPYRAAMRDLAKKELVFRCDLTRSQIAAAASAPHAGEHEVHFSRSLRPAPGEAWNFEDESAAYRFAVGEEDVEIADAVAGRTRVRPCDEVGDFILWTKQGVPAYQLAVVVDDARQGVTHVVRGDDLLPSAARQALIYQALNLPVPAWCHVPLVVGPDGKRLAKRHGDARIESYRNVGVPPERVVAKLAAWCGIGPSDGLTSQEFADRFQLEQLPRGPVCFRPEDHEWILRGTSS